MKKHIFGILFILGSIFTAANAQNQQKPDSLGLPGDNLNLNAVMKLFQNSATLEEFEKSLNAEDSKVNNLDLNNDDKTDYIRVIDNVEKDVHHIVLQVPVNEKENQDVAVFIVEKNKKGEVDIQLIGDEDLYGKDYILEPNYSDSAKATTSTPNPGYVKQSSTTNTDSNGNTTIINNYTTKETASWPVVSYMFMPTYTVWVSPWSWGYYPPYWNPWTPWYWHSYYGYHYNYGYYYYGNYRYTNYYRNPVVYNSYYSRRSVSVTCNVNIKSGGYRRSYSQPESRKIGENAFKNDPRNSGNNMKERAGNASNNRASTIKSGDRTSTIKSAAPDRKMPNRSTEKFGDRMPTPRANPPRMPSGGMRRRP